MTLTLDHPMHWVPDREATVEAYREAGLTTFPTPFPPAPGARSSTWWDGSGYVEVLGLVDREQASESDAYGNLPAAILPAVEDTLAAGGGVLNFVAHATDLRREVRRMRAAGIDVDTTVVTLGRAPRRITLSFAWPVSGPVWRPILLHYSIPGWVRRTLERVRRGRPPKFRLDHLTIETPHPEAATDWLSTVVGAPAGTDPAGRPQVPLRDRHVRFVPGPADRIAAVGIRGPGAPDATIDGLRFESDSRAGEPPGTRGSRMPPRVAPASAAGSNNTPDRSGQRARPRSG